MPASSEVDSMQYVITYGIESPEGIPPDFLIREPLDDFQAGLFLPRDQPDWLGRSRYPPRILSLVGRALWIDAHPSAMEPCHRIALDELVYIESGRLLLRGWLRFVTASVEHTVFYSTVYQRTVGRFLRRLRAAWMAPEPPSTQPSGEQFEEPPEVKFRNALAYELDPDEPLRGSMFVAPRETSLGFLICRWKSWAPGDLLLLTPRRLLWITDRDRGSQARYGTIARYAPLSRIRSVTWEVKKGDGALRIELAAGRRWEIPMPPEHRHAARWLESLYAH